MYVLHDRITLSLAYIFACEYYQILYLNLLKMLCDLNLASVTQEYHVYTYSNHNDATDKVLK